MITITKRLSDFVLPAYYDFWKTKKTYAVCKGSRGSGKSKCAAMWHIFHMMKYPLANTLCVRKVERTLRDSVYADLKWAVDKLGVGDAWITRVSPLELEYKPTGQKILFRGVDDGIKLTSISVDHGILCWLYFEEAYEIMKEEDFDKINESIRGTLPDGYFKRVTAIFNPWSDKIFWKKRFFDEESDNVFALTTTYKDNPYLSETDLQLFEEMRVKNPRRYRVAGLGDWGIVEGVIYENWREEAFSLEEVKKIKGIRSVFGLDFGYTNDPTALFCSLVDLQGKRLYVFDEMYQKGMSNEAIEREISRMGLRKERIVADSAEPKSIDRLRELGMSNVRAARKGKDSVNNGIDYLQDFEIIVNPKCVNFLTEISNYTWDEDRFGKKINKPIDDFNHLMDAMRYGMEEHIKGRSFSFD